MLKGSLPHTPYADGELLRAWRLQADFDLEQQLLEWHAVALHNTWGIVRGLDIAPAKKEGGVTVGPGLAYDFLGRALQLTESTELGPPHTAGPAPEAPSSSNQYVLVICRDGEASQVVRSADCRESYLPGRRAERVELRWQRPQSLKVGLEVPLVKARVIEGDVVLTDFGVRRYARRLARPHLVTGRSAPGQAWHPWTENGRTIGWALEVDTSEGGFVTTPHYFASLVKDPFASRDAFRSALSGPFVFVARPTPESFKCVLQFTIRNITWGTAIFKSWFVHRVLEIERPQVAWLAVEPSMP